MKWNKLSFFKALFLLFLGMNLVAFLHAYKFTHFEDSTVIRTQSPEKLSTYQKVKSLLTGVSNPRPQTDEYPAVNYKTFFVESVVRTECWMIGTEDTSGCIVMLFHGYCSKKSDLLEKANLFLEMGNTVCLIDFMGSGGSEGNRTTVGWYESEQVRDVVNVIRNQYPNKKILLVGSSMGAVAIMRAVAKLDVQVDGLILECPFGSMQKTVESRFRNMGVPSFPMAYLLVFWGGVQNGFWAYSHNPEDYALKINTTVLLMNGAKDRNVSMSEVETIYKRFGGSKKLKVFENAGHEDYTKKYREEWKEEVSGFIKRNYLL